MQQFRTKSTITRATRALPLPVTSNGDSLFEPADQATVAIPVPHALTNVEPIAGVTVSGLIHVSEARRLRVRQTIAAQSNPPSGLRGLLVPAVLIMGALFVSLIGFMSVDMQAMRMIGGITLVVLCFGMMAGQMYFLSATLRKHERAHGREKVLAKVGAALIAARSRESIYEAALDGAQALLGWEERLRVSLLVGDMEQLAVVAATGIRTHEVIGNQVDPGKFRQVWAEAPIEPQMLALQDFSSNDLKEMFGFDTQMKSAFVVPLMIKEEFGGVLAAAGDSPIPEEYRDALGSLGVNLALALERQTLEEEVAYQIFHDPLTSLATRALFLDQLDQALAHFGRRSNSLAVLTLDLDDFKVLNDSLGRRIGDQLLAAVAQRLKGCLKGGATIARSGGDEFLILLNDIVKVRDATLIAERMIEQLRLPFVLAGQQVSVSGSMGLAFNEEQDGPDDLLRSAEAAMYSSKNMGKARYSVFNPYADTVPSATERLDLEGDLRKAIERKELTLYYQPVLELDTGKIIEMEALVRWEHPQRGMISSGQFIPLAEQTGLIVPIGQWALEEACRQGKAWQEHYPSDPPLTISMNLSTVQTRHPNLVADLARTLKKTGLSPDDLRLEITEKVALEDDVQIVPTLRDLRSLGIRLTIDDFTTGQSALKCMKRYPVDTLKLGQSHVKKIARDPEDTGTIHAIIAFARTMNLRLVVKGIETYEQLTIIEKLGCKYGQGHQLARPMDSAAASVMLSASPRGETGAL